ncbi:MAG: aldolase/citrate lyase family protein [Acidobacteria bacterium]|nr:aldolase/citrate lyase family protein [Acidobacteriota bacterium]
MHLLRAALALALSASFLHSAERLNRVVQLLEQGTPPLGIFATRLDPRSGAAVSSAPLDFVIIDLEHSPYDPTRLESYLLGMIDKRRVATGKLQPAVAPIVRLPANGREHVEYMIKQVLDLGAFGVVVPHVRNREDALAAVRAMRYAQAENARYREPEGHRGVGYGWAARYWGVAAAEYVAKADLWPLDPEGELVLWCMIETREGVEHATEIASTPGVGGIWKGMRKWRPPPRVCLTPVSSSTFPAERWCPGTASPCGSNRASVFSPLVPIPASAPALNGHFRSAGPNDIPHSSPTAVGGHPCR